MTRAAHLALLFSVLALDACRCQREGAGVGPDSEEASDAAAPTGKKCIVHLHGKGGRGAPTSVEGDVTHLYPEGNAAGWEARQWLYFPDNRYEETKGIVAAAIRGAGCGRVIVHGFSNGASAAAKLYCHAERFGNTLVGAVIDDPVPDHGVEPCRRPRGVKLRLYVTGALKETAPGWACKKSDFTCEGDSTIGMTRYAEHLGTSAAISAQDKHEPYTAPPEYQAWW
jgi:hypothetical protein